MDDLTRRLQNAIGYHKGRTYCKTCFPIGAREFCTVCIAIKHVCSSWQVGWRSKGEKCNEGEWFWKNKAHQVSMHGRSFAQCRLCRVHAGWIQWEWGVCFWNDQLRACIASQSTALSTLKVMIAAFTQHKCMQIQHRSTVKHTPECWSYKYQWAVHTMWEIMPQ